jgi:polygalacturonase
MKKISSNFLILFLFLFQIACAQTERNNSGWKQLDGILSKINPPIFQNKTFNITNYGAIGDGISDCTNAFKNAIDDCSKNGGGKVVVPKGEFLTGPIHLKSNVNLYVSEGAVIKFSKDKNKYLPVVYTRWEGVECMNYSPLIYAYGQENIAVTGKGVLDGQGSNDNWWSWKGKTDYGWKKGMPNQDAARNKLQDMAEKNVPVEKRIFGDGYYLRPDFIQPYKCKNVLIEGVTFKNSPMWFIHPVLSENVSIINVTVEGLGPNNDGCDPECCKDVLIKGCSFNTGDDCIAIKSGRNTDGRRVNVPCENIVIQNCKMKDGHGGVVIGSEVSGGIRNIFAENCEMNSPHLDRAIRIKTNSIRGGTIENIFVRKIKVGQVGEAVVKINFFYEEGDAGKFTPVVRNINIENITSKQSKFAIWIKAYERSPVKNLKVENCEFKNVKNANIIENVKNFILDSVKINNKEISLGQ